MSDRRRSDRRSDHSRVGIWRVAGSGRSEVPNSRSEGRSARAGRSTGPSHWCSRSLETQMGRTPPTTLYESYSASRSPSCASYCDTTTRGVGLTSRLVESLEEANRIDGFDRLSGAHLRIGRGGVGSRACGTGKGAAGGVGLRFQNMPEESWWDSG